MLPLFESPPSSHSTQSAPAILDILNAFIAWVNRSPLPESIRQDCIKILETMRWIKVNSSQLRQFIDNKAEYLSQLPDRDQANGVVRDHLGTSLHFNSYQWCQLIKNAKTAIERTGMIQYRFKTQEQADQLSQWLQSCKSLAAYEIDRCQTQKKQKGTEIEYVVRLMPLQLEVLC